MARPDISRRELIIGVGAGAAGAVLSVPTRAESRVATTLSPDATRFGIIADVHQDVMHDGPRRLGMFLDAMKDVSPEFVLQLGDFCTPHERNSAFLDLWNSHTGPKYHVIGNHETDGGYTREQVVDRFAMTHRYYSFDRAGLHFIVLDGNDRGGTSGGYPRFIAEEQVAWIREDLASTDRPTVVFIHQPLDSEDGVDNRAQIRTLLETAKRTPGHADVIAVVAGHSHVDYCRLINGIYYVMLNSASYQWVGGDYRHQSYAPEIHARATSLDRTCPYRDPLWAVMTVDLHNRCIEIEGRSTTWVGPTPVECGVDFENGYWGWDPTYSRPVISSWRVPFAATGDLNP